MKQILLPTDFSDNSWNAIEYAIQLFKEEECTFNLLNTYMPVIYSAEHVLGNPSQFGLGDPIQNASAEKLQEFVAKIFDTFGENPKHIFKVFSQFDTLVSGIKDFISEHKIDLVVMGTKGATGAREVLFGSNTVRVFKEIKCPILAIPSGFKFETPLEILFPSDLRVDYRTFQIDILKQIATAYQSNVNALYISMSDELSYKQISHQIELEFQFKETPFLFHHYKNESVTAGIDQFQIDSKVNLLAMVNNKRSFFENLFFTSNINQIGFHLKVPFLVMPPKL